MMIRPRRLRQNSSIRSLLEEYKVLPSDLIAPLFVTDQSKKSTPILSMPGQFRYSIDDVIEEARILFEHGILAIALFPVISEDLKTSKGDYALSDNCYYYEVIQKIKNAVPGLLVMTDVALDPYSSDGHDGIVNPETGEILNDETLFILEQMAYKQAKAGADIVGPSDMMDGRIQRIRSFLDLNGFEKTLIMSYTTKYASSFYGPFRDALDSAPKKGDKKSYQMSYGNLRESLREIELDIKEGADILMVKPGLPYLDILSKMREKTSLPIAVYNVSGEYSMIKASAEKGWIKEDEAVLETLTAFKRAGADMILTYFAKQFAIKS